MNTEWVNALWGGVIIGIAVTLMLLMSGRVTGISGIIYGVMGFKKSDVLWRVCFLFGLVSGGLILKYLKPEVFSGSIVSKNWTVAVAGLLVGFGTILGSGCTSGHGVCGISRLSLRSVIATLIFICCGVLSVVVLKKVGVLP